MAFWNELNSNSIISVQRRRLDRPSLANNDWCPLLVDSLAHLNRHLLLNLRYF